MGRSRNCDRCPFCFLLIIALHSEFLTLIYQSPQVHRKFLRAFVHAFLRPLHDNADNAERVEVRQENYMLRPDFPCASYPRDNLKKQLPCNCKQIGLKPVIFGRIKSCLVERLTGQVPFYTRSKAFNMPYMIACGLGGQPGMYTSTGIIRSMPLLAA